MIYEMPSLNGRQYDFTNLVVTLDEQTITELVESVPMEHPFWREFVGFAIAEWAANALPPISERN